MLLDTYLAFNYSGIIDLGLNAKTWISTVHSIIIMGSKEKPLKGIETSYIGFAVGIFCKWAYFASVCNRVTKSKTATLLLYINYSASKLEIFH